MEAIRLIELTKSFGPTEALAGVSFAVERGRIFGLLGPNGAGKTTLISLLLGLLEPTAGRVEVLGFDTRAQASEVRARAGALLEHPGIYEQLSAQDNLAFYGRVWRLPVAERDARIEELLTGMGLWERRRERAGTWSRGMKQRLALARVLLHRPPLVLLDEPTAGLDVVAANAVRENLEALVAREGTTVLLTTHNMAEAERLCSRVAVMRKGRLVAMGSPDELRERAGDSRLEIVGRGFAGEVLDRLRDHSAVTSAESRDGRLVVGLRDGADPTLLVQLVVESGIQVEEVRRSKANLEDVFLNLMEEKK
jgi:ABC-2 type transport system ATP-binding protein